MANDKKNPLGDSDQLDQIQVDDPADQQGSNRERTAVVPLQELARRAQDRLRTHSQSRKSQEHPREEGGEHPSIPMGEIMDVLRAAASVEEVAGVLVEVIANIFPRVLLLWERAGMLYGFASRGMGLSEVKLLTIELPLRFFQDMIAQDLEVDSFRGSIDETPQVRQFYGVVGGHPPEILVVPVFVTPQDRWVLYADNQPAPLPAFELRLIEVILARAGARADILLDREWWTASR